MKYEKAQRIRQAKVLSEHPDLFGNLHGFSPKSYSEAYLLSDGKYNLYGPIREEVPRYARENAIKLWNKNEKGPTGNTLSSQIMCFNHLFAIRKDPDAVLAILNGIPSCPRFEEALPLELDRNDHQFVTFEVISRRQHLNEKVLKRGAHCTSVDALIAGRTADGETWIIPIEWKYKESYPHPKDKSQEDRRWEDGTVEPNGKGLDRLKSYSGLIDSSEYLVPLKEYAHSIYFFEPFYELMRQTLWAEQMVLHRDEEWIRADRFLHLNVIPGENAELLHAQYGEKGLGLEDTWRSMLKQDSYQIITPRQLLAPLAGNASYEGLFHYLSIRYWDPL